MKILLWLQKKSNFTFWPVFLGSNLVLFVPMRVLTKSAFFPTLSGWDALKGRANYDIWRLGLEWLVLIALWLNLPRLWTPRGKRAFRWGSFVVLVLFFAYQVYEAVDVAIYHNTPNFYNDGAFLGGGIGFVMEGLHLPWWEYAAGGLGVVAVVGLVYGLAVASISLGERTSPFTRRAVLALAVLGLVYALAFPQATAKAEGEVASLSLKIAANIRQARLTRERVQAMKQVSPFKVYDYRRDTLAEHPNIYLLFLESYGSVLINDPEFKPRYTALMEKIQRQLESQGWHTASGFSKSPVWGGGSWMAYTSALSGVRIAQQPQYLALKYGFQHTPYPNLGRYLQSQGYRFVWVVPIDRKLDPAIWASNERFYGADVWITFKDLHYHGPEYSWGPSPPDQYTFGFLRDWLNHHQDKPTFVFSLTQNTHYYFAPVPPFVKDWQSLNDPNIDNPNAHPKLSDTEAYMEAVEYDWKVLRWFISMAGKNDVFILVGDHQPPLVSRPREGFETIVHVLAHDPQFVNGFLEYGLKPGMLPVEGSPPLHHEGLYSLLARQLVARWGANPKDLPAYHPQGIQIPGILPNVRAIFEKRKFKPQPGKRQ